MDISVHTVVPDADVAADWYAGAFGARELGRIPLFWGERHGQLADPFGHRWNIAQHLRDVGPEEVAAAAAAANGETTFPDPERARCQPLR
jgi:PhnB protein